MAAPDTLAVSAFNTLLGQYNGSVVGIQMGSIALAKDLFFNIALVSVGVLALNRLLSKNVDATDTYIELIRLIIYLNVFYLFISDFPNLLETIVGSFKQAAFYMGNMIGTVGAVGSTSPSAFKFVQATNPGTIFDEGVTIATTILTSVFHQFSFANFGMSLLAILTSAVILYCFGCVAIKIVIIEISSKIILSAGIFLLAFAGSPWTRDYATRYIGSFFSIGIQMLFTYLLVGIGGALTSQWADLLNHIPKGQVIETYIAVMMAAFVYYKLCLTLPEQATSYLAGGLAISPGQPPSIGKAALVGAAGVAFGGKSLMGLGANVHGAAKSWGTVSQAAKTTGEGRIKTLNTAAVGMFKDGMDEMKGKWESKVNDTFAGKFAQRTAKVSDEKANVKPGVFKDGGGI